MYITIIREKPIEILRLIHIVFHLGFLFLCLTIFWQNTFADIDIV